jgi:hypothetical protein
MSIRSAFSRRSSLAVSLSLAAPASLLLGLAGCDTQAVTPQTKPVTVMCEQQQDVLLSHDFASGLGGFSLVTSQPLDPDHTWAPDAVSSLRSDPAGTTLANYYNRADSPTFAPMGRANLKLKIRMAYNVSTNNIFQLVVGSNSGADNKRSIIADYNGQNPSFPAADDFEVPIPAAFANDPDVFISLLVQAGGAGGDYGARVEKVQVVGDPGGPGMVFGDNFIGGLSNWSVYSDPGVEGHVWAAESVGESCAQARSDVAGQTISANYTRLESNPFSLVGKSSGVVVVSAKYSLPPQGRYQVFIADQDIDGHRSLIGEFQGQNAGYPASVTQEFHIPADFLGRPNVRLAFLELTGEGEGQGYGIALQNVHVMATP